MTEPMRHTYDQTVDAEIWYRSIGNQLFVKIKLKEGGAPSLDIRHVTVSVKHPQRPAHVSEFTPKGSAD